MSKYSRVFRIHSIKRIKHVNIMNGTKTVLYIKFLKYNKNHPIFSSFPINVAIVRVRCLTFISPDTFTHSSHGYDRSPIMSCQCLCNRRPIATEQLPCHWYRWIGCCSAMVEAHTFQRKYHALWAILEWHVCKWSASQVSFFLQILILDSNAVILCMIYAR